MNTTVKYISCISSQDRQRSVFRSLLTIIGQGIDSRLGAQWVYREEGPCDVAVVDFDDEAASGRLEELGGAIVVALGRSRDALSGHAHALGKPLRWQDLLETLQHLEKRLRSPLPPVAAPADPVPAACLKSPPPALPAETRDAVTAETAPVLSLNAWPDLPRLDAGLQQDAARVCALLSRRAASRSDIAVFLGLDGERVRQVLDALSAAAHPGRDWLDIAGDTVTAQGPSLASASPPEKPSSFLAKFWSRLRGT